MANAGYNAQQLIQEFIQVVGQSMISTNAHLAAMADVLASGPRDSDRNGYTWLKPKKDITKVTAEDARSLMIELAQFEIDMGEIGVQPLSEAGYRQLRATCISKARGVLDLAAVSGQGLMMIQTLTNMVTSRASRAQCDAAGSALYAFFA